MPMRRRRSFRRSGKTRAKEWISYTTINPTTFVPNNHISITPTATGAIYASYILSPDEMNTMYDEPTLVRGLLGWTVACPTTAPAGNNLYFAHGLIKSDIEAPTGIISATYSPIIPRPFLDGDSPWIWQDIRRISTITGFTGFQSFFNGLGGGPFDEFKTKRKFQNGQGLMAVVETYGETTFPTMYVNIWGRLLFLNS